MMTEDQRHVDVVCHTCAAGQKSRPPTNVAHQLDKAVNLIDLARNDGNAALRELPPAAPLFSVVDLVTALGHLRQAALLLDGVADTLEAAAHRAVESSTPEVTP